MTYSINTYTPYRFIDIQDVPLICFLDNLFVYGYSTLSSQEIENIILNYMQIHGISRDTLKNIKIITGDRKKIKSSSFVSLATNGNNAFIVGAHPHSVKGSGNLLNYLKLINKGQRVVEALKANKQLGKIQSASLKSALDKLFVFNNK